MRASHKERFERMVADLRLKGLKLTPQRLAILRMFSADESHPTAQDLYARLRVTFPTMSFATVYNTLDTLARTGLAGTVRLPGKRGDAARFDPNTEPHHHAVCDMCGSITDIPATTRALVASDALHSAAPGFEVRSVERLYRGVCAECAGTKGNAKKLLS